LNFDGLGSFTDVIVRRPAHLHELWTSVPGCATADLFYNIQPISCAEPERGQFPTPLVGSYAPTTGERQRTEVPATIGFEVDSTLLTVRADETSTHITVNEEMLDRTVHSSRRAAKAMKSTTCGSA